MLKSIFYLIALAAAFYFLDVLLLWVLHKFVAPCYSSLLEISLFWKIILFIVGFIVFGYAYQFFQPIGMAVSGVLGLLYPGDERLHVGISAISGVMYVGNIILGLIVLWRSPGHFNFWVVLELIYFSLVIWGVNSILAMNPKERKFLQN